MNNAIDTAINRIKRKIPIKILETVLKDNHELGLENALHDEIIVENVIRDCNLSGGKTIQIPLLSNYHEPLIDEAWSVYRIPADVRENRNIVEVHRVQYNPRNRPAYFAYTGATQAATLFSHDPRIHMTAFDKAQQMMLTSKTGIGGAPPVPQIELLQGDLVRLLPSPRTYIPWVITCRLAYDNEMNNLNSEAIDRFAELCVVATKMYCYNELAVNMDIGIIKFGAELPAIKDIVSSWSDLSDLYQEKLNLFCKANSLDIQRMAGLIQYMM